MNTIWILVINQAEAQVYSAKNLPGQIQMVGTVTNSQGSAHARDLVSDSPGRVHDRIGSGRHSMEPDTGIKEEERRKFVKDIVGRLETALTRGKFNRLVILAAPAVLGVMRKNLSGALVKLVIKEIPKDVIGQAPEKIQAQLKRSFSLK